MLDGEWASVLCLLATERKKGWLERGEKEKKEIYTRLQYNANQNRRTWQWDRVGKPLPNAKLSKSKGRKSRSSRRKLIKSVCVRQIGFEEGTLCQEINQRLDGKPHFKDYIALYFRNRVTSNSKLIQGRNIREIENSGHPIFAKWETCFNSAPKCASAIGQKLAAGNGQCYWTSIPISILVASKLKLLWKRKRRKTPQQLCVAN